MDTPTLKKFAQAARRMLMDQVAAKLTGVLLPTSSARRESPKAVAELEKAIDQRGQEQIVERVAYIWFNRFCALRFMDVSHYSRVGVVSPAEGQFQPEILGEAKMGHIDEDMVTGAAVRERVFGLLRGKITSNDPQGEAYRLLLVAVCNYWHKTMPFMFERIHDYAELLMPDDLLSESSILAQTREAMTEENCKDVEVIGWLYQFYISEKKDAVFEGLKKNKKVTPENIPAATQLFTPHWIVRYLVENSLGRLWMLNRPESGLAAQMDYYIKPEQAETDFLRVNSPEEIKICDPACGSGHMLTYAFDLLHAIYEEEGYAPAEIPEKILTHNLYGVEIDERAGALAAFALSMKARAKQRRFFRKPVLPNICVLQNIEFKQDELSRYIDAVGRELFTAPLVTVLHQFEEADNFGSLIRPEIGDAAGMRKILKGKDVDRNLLLQGTHEKVLRVLKQSEYLSPRYHVVIANPPYMGGKGMNGRLGAWAKDNYTSSKSDLFAMFMERGLEMVPKFGYHAMVTMQSWMFLSSYETLRSRLLGQTSIECMSHMANMVMGIAFGTAATVIKIGGNAKAKGAYCYIEYADIDASNKPMQFPPHNERNRAASQCGWFFRASAADFKKIPGSPIAYWVSERLVDAFQAFDSLSKLARPRQGLATSDNDRFLKLWHEVSLANVGLSCENHEKARLSQKKWFPCQKGGPFRKWFGNNNFVVNWYNDGEEILAYAAKLYGSPTRTIKNIQFYFQEGITWSTISSSALSMRYSPVGFISETKGAICFADKRDILLKFLGFCNSCLVNHFLKALSPTLDYHEGPVGKLPVTTNISPNIVSNVDVLVQQHKTDWDSYETSWNFTTLPLLSLDYHQSTLADTYAALRSYWFSTTLETQRLEEENNCIFIEAYGLQDELTPDVPLKEITLTCNPYYRYGGDKTEEDLEALLLADTMKELISYSVGCMFGRYALEKPGLVLANQGESIEDYFRIISQDLDNSVKLESVVLKKDALPHCFRCGKEMHIGEARFILQRYDQNSIAGRPMIYCQNCCRDYENDISINIPLAEFSYAHTVDQKWTEQSTLNIFLDMTKCFEFQTCDAINTGISFQADNDNVIPILDDDWFTDDISERFRTFLRLTFGAEHYEENLAFIEQAIGKDIRKYFIKDFYTDHMKRYKKRPIYWLFSSPKGSFNALIYMHRYTPDTVSIVMNDYLREFQIKLATEKVRLETIEASARSSPVEKNRATKKLDTIRKSIKELEDYERDILYPLATRQIEIDLDDGVKANYPKFGTALKKIPGLDAKEN